MGIGKRGATGSEAVQVGSVYLPRVATEESHPVVEVVNGQKKDIWSGLCGQGFRDEMTCDEKEKDEQRPHKRGKSAPKGYSGKN